MLEHFSENISVECYPNAAFAAENWTRDYVRVSILSIFLIISFAF